MKNTSINDGKDRTKTDMPVSGRVFDATTVTAGGSESQHDSKFTTGTRYSNRGKVAEKCSICHKVKPIAITLPGGTVSGSLLKHKPKVLVCGDCEAQQAEQYALSQRRHAQEQVEMIEQMMAENSSLHLDAALKTWQGEIEKWESIINSQRSFRS